MNYIRLLCRIVGLLMIIASIYEGHNNDWAHATYDLVLGIWMLRD